MSFNLSFPSQNQDSSNITIESGQVVFLLGSNGTGKSSLMQRFAQQNHGRFRKISAHRQTTINNDGLDMTPASKLQTEQRIQNEDHNFQSRFRDQFAASRASMTIYELIDSENVRARAIAAAVDEGNHEEIEKRKQIQAPIAVINELLRTSNIPVQIGIRKNEQIVASRNGGPEYGAAQLSDGERNALLIAGNILTAPEQTLFLVDEPERHLHRSIISPLLHQLFRRRPDCGFVVSTHDHELPLHFEGARLILLRSCKFSGEHPQEWETDELPTDAPLGEDLRRDLLGSRRKILFVEGTETSIDKPLYSTIFPMVSVVPKGTCRDVENAASGSRAASDFHWLQAFGVVDGDGLTADEIEKKRQGGVYVLPFYSIEALYFHPKLIHETAKTLVGAEHAAKVTDQAIDRAISSVAVHTDRLSQYAAKKRARARIAAQIPNDDMLIAGHPLEIKNDGPEILSKLKEELIQAISDRDWPMILRICPLKSNSSAMPEISATLGFRSPEHYKRAVIQLLQRDQETANFVRDLFGDLYSKLQ